MLKPVCGLVSAPRKWCHRVATDLRNMRDDRSSHGTLLVDFPRRETASIHALWYLLMTSCWQPVAVHLENMSLTASTISMRGGNFGSHVCSHSAAHESHKSTSNAPERGADLRSISQNTWTEISLINFPSHRRRDRKSKITPLELSQPRALEMSLALVGNATFATVAGASVTLDETYTASYSGHDLWR